MGIEPHVTATESPWQNGLVERHGQVLGEIVSIMVDQSQLKGEADMHMAGVFAATAKNRRPDRTGHSARTRLFGVAERFPGSVLDARLEGENVAEIERCVRDPVMRKATTMRAIAMEAMIRLDSDRRWQQIISSGTARQVRTWRAGQQVFFWRAQKAAHALRGRRARLFARWHGPAVVLGRQIGRTLDDSQCYWIAYEGSLLLVAGQHIRSATREESISDHVMNRLLRESQEALDQERGQVFVT